MLIDITVFDYAVASSASCVASTVLKLKPANAEAILAAALLTLLFAIIVLILF